MWRNYSASTFRVEKGGNVANLSVVSDMWWFLMSDNVLADKKHTKTTLWALRSTRHKGFFKNINTLW